MRSEWSKSVIPDPLILMIIDATNAGNDVLGKRTERLVKYLTDFLGPLYELEKGI